MPTVVSSSAPFILKTKDHYRVYDGPAPAAEYLRYSGSLYGDSSVSVDMQPIFVSFVPQKTYELSDWDSSQYLKYQSGFTEVISIVVYDGESESVVYLNMEYCTENATNQELGYDASTSTFPYLANDYIQKKFINGTYFSATQKWGNRNTTEYKQTGIEVTYDNGTVQVLNGSGIFPNMVTPDITWRLSGWLTIPDNSGHKPVKIRVFRNSLPISDYIEVENCVPEHSYTLFYINPHGAIDWIYCDRKNAVTYNADRHSMTKYANIQDRTAFGRYDYLNNTYKSYTLNTDVMGDQASKKMYGLFNSPRVWLYDHDNDRISSVVITDKSLKIKRFENDKMFNYTITVEDSQTFSIQ